MGSFERLSVLVIVVIIVMILVVAIVEWTSGPSESPAAQPGDAMQEPAHPADPAPPKDVVGGKPPIRAVADGRGA